MLLVLAGLALSLLLLIDALLLIVATSVFDLGPRGINRTGIALVVLTAGAAVLLLPQLGWSWL